MQHVFLALVALLAVSAPNAGSSTESPARGSERLGDGKQGERWTGERDSIASGRAGRTSDAEIRKLIIADSIASYPGPCACPYHRARNGSSCGRRSAYSRGGGYELLCYPQDVSDEMVSDYRAAHGLE